MTPPNQSGDTLPRCRTCGGSGMLRLADQRYRTCLDCLGQGRKPGLPPATTTADLLQGSLPRSLSAAVPSSASR